jgi:hypothetical protein
VILVDANLLIYAVNRDLPWHRQAKAWLEKAIIGAEVLGLPWVSVLAFLRLCTNPRVFPRPLSPDAAIGYVDEWLAQPPVRLVVPGPGHWAVLRNLLLQAGMSGNLTTDAHIAALALEHGCSICSADNDFQRFPGVKHINPLVGQ